MVVLGIDIGGTKTSFGILKNQQLLKVHTVPTAKDTLAQFEQSLLTGARHYLKNTPHTPRAIGVAAPGFLNSHSGVVHYASNLSILRDYPLKERLQTALNVPVFIDNDANLAGFAEQQAGAAKNAGSCLYVTLSTGIGGAFITEQGEIFTGSHGMACDIGHTSVLPAGPVCSCGQRGCWEAVASGTAIAQNASARFNTPCTTADVFALAANGHEEAQKLLNEAAIYSGMALANGAKLFDADTVVMGGSVSLSQTGFINAIRQHFQIFMSNFRIIPLHTAALGPHTGVIGAGLYAQRHTQP